MRKALWSSAALVVLLTSILSWGQAQAATSTVTMGSDSEPNAFKFFPETVTIPVGSTVKWQNKSDIPHDATARNGAFKSDQLTKNQTFEFTFTTPGDFEYICTVSGHEDAGMKALVKVTGGGGSPTTAPSSTTTTASTATTGGSPTSTTSKAAAGDTTTTTRAGAAGATSTTQAPSVTPTSAPETAGVTSTTVAPAESPGGGEEAAAGDDHASSGGSEKKEPKNSPVGIAFAAVSTVLLAGISGKLLASKS